MVRLRMKAIAILISIGTVHLVDAKGKFIFRILLASNTEYADYTLTRS